jgi:hypothetical protein
MADPSNDLMHSGPMGALIGVGVTLTSAIAAALKFNARIAEVEAKAKKIADDLADLEEKVDDRLRELEKGPNADAVKVIVAASMAPYQEKAIELREKLAEINGTLRSITGDDRRAH